MTSLHLGSVMDKNPIAFQQPDTKAYFELSRCQLIDHMSQSELVDLNAYLEPVLGII